MAGHARVADSMGEITAASQEQTTGIEQITIALPSGTGDDASSEPFAELLQVDCPTCPHRI